MERHQKQVLKEAERIRLEGYCINELNDMVDYRTGEIMSSREYESMPVKWEDIKPTIPAIGSITSHAQMRRFMSSKDRRKLRLFNGCRGIYDIDKGKAWLDKSTAIFTTSMLERMFQLVERIDYMNTIVTTPQELCTSLKTRHSNLHRCLNSLGQLVRVNGPNDGLQKGNLRVEISPAYGFRYETSGFEYARKEKVVAWYRCVASSSARLAEAPRGKRA